MRYFSYQTKVIETQNTYKTLIINSSALPFHPTVFQNQGQ
jgi:hypothetical protein